MQDKYILNLFLIYIIKTMTKYTTTEKKYIILHSWKKTLLNKKQKKTIVVVTHSEKAASFAERIVHVKDGYIN